MLDKAMFCWHFVTVIVLNAVFVASNTFDVNPKASKIVNAIEGEPVVLPCHTAIDSPVVWMYQDQKDQHSPAAELSNSGKIINGHARRFHLDTSTKGDYNLVIKTVELMDAGLYTCDEDNGIGERHFTSVNVSGETTPVFAVLSGRSVTLPCYTLLDVAADWQRQLQGSSELQNVVRNGMVLGVYHDRFYVNSSKRGWYNLNIRDVQASDAGVYTCLEGAGLGPGRFTRKLVVSDESTATSWSPSSAQTEAVVYVETVTSCACIRQDKLFIASVVILVIGFCMIIGAIFLFKWIICHRKSRHNDKQPSVGKPCKKEIKPLIDVNELRRLQKKVKELFMLNRRTKKRDTLIFQLAHERETWDGCTAQMVEQIQQKLRDQKLSLDEIIIVGLNGYQSRGEIMAQEIAKQLRVPFTEIIEYRRESEEPRTISYTDPETQKRYGLDIINNIWGTRTRAVLVDNIVYSKALQTDNEQRAHFPMEAAEELAQQCGLRVIGKLSLVKVVDSRDGDTQLKPDVEWNLVEIGEEDFINSPAYTA